MWSSADMGRVDAGSMGLLTREQQAGRERLGAAADDGDAGRAWNLASTAQAPQLDACFEQCAVARQAAARKLAAARADGQLAVERDALPTLDERAGLSAGSQAERFEPPNGVDGEPVVDLGHVDVRRRQLGS